MAGEAQLRVAIYKDVPRNCFMFQWHFVEQAMGVGDEVAFDIQVEESNGKGCACGECPSFEEMGVDAFSMGDVFLLGKAAEADEEMARLRRQGNSVVHK